jgi:hypothetical protein
MFRLSPDASIDTGQRRRRSAAIFDYPSTRDHDGDLDGVLDAATLIADLLAPYRRRAGVVRAVSEPSRRLAERVAAATGLVFDEAHEARMPLVILVDGSLSEPLGWRRAIGTAREQRTPEVVAAIACATRFALRELARYVDAVYCASMRTVSV